MTQRECYDQMAEAYAQLTGFRPDEASDIAIRLHLLAGQLEQVYGKMEQIKGQSMAQTAWGKALDAHAAMQGLTRKPAEHAAGVLQFTRSNLAVSASIPKGILCTAQDGTAYETTDTALFPAGEPTCSVPARACIAGKAGNAAADTVTVLSQPVGWVTSVTNAIPFVGGTDAEEDETLRSRLLAACMQQNNGANALYYETIARSFQGITHARVRGGAQLGQVIVTVAADHQTSVPQSVREALQAELNRVREPCTIVTVEDAQAVTVPLSVQIEPIGDFAQVQVKASALVRQAADTLAMGERLALAKLGQLLMEQKLVSNWRFVLPTADVTPNAGQVVRAGTITVTRMEG